MTEITAREAADVARRHFALEVEADPLDGELDANFALRDVADRRYVLKLSTRDEPTLRFQTAMLAHLAERAPDLGTPRPVHAVDGAPLVADPRWPEARVRVVTWVEGRPYGEVAGRDTRLGREVGRYAGRLTAALRGFAHPEAPITHLWDLDTAAELLPAARHIEATAVRSAVVHTLERYRNELAVRVRALERSVIHGDLNDSNVLVAGSGHEVSGAIDFGDAAFAPTIFELAIAAAYACLDTDEPDRAIADVVDGFREAAPATPIDAALVRPLAETRLAMSLAIAARRRAEQPGRVHWQRSVPAVAATLQSLVEPQLSAGPAPRRRTRRRSRRPP